MLKFFSDTMLRVAHAIIRTNVKTYAKLKLLPSIPINTFTMYPAWLSAHIANAKKYMENAPIFTRLCLPIAFAPLVYKLQ